MTQRKASPADAGSLGQAKGQSAQDRFLAMDFFARSTANVARDLIGKKLMRSIGSRQMACRIVEAEAYLAENDEACHAAFRRTPRNEVMFGGPSLIYVYSIHAKFCFNIVTEDAGRGCAVLIRAAVPLAGQSWMREHRPVDRDEQLLSGPAKLCQALAIDRTLNGQPLGRSNGLWLVDDGFRVDRREIRVTPRIGVTAAKDHPLRYVLRGSPYASGPRRLR